MGVEMALPSGQDYSPSKQASVTADSWQDSVMLFQRKQERPRYEASGVAAIAANSTALRHRMEVGSLLDDAKSRAKTNQAAWKEQERRAFWHLKWSANAANDPSEAHKCSSP